MTLPRSQIMSHLHSMGGSRCKDLSGSKCHTEKSHACPRGANNSGEPSPGVTHSNGTECRTEAADHHLLGVEDTVLHRGSGRTTL